MTTVLKTEKITSDNPNRCRTMAHLLDNRMVVIGDTLHVRLGTDEENVYMDVFSTIQDKLDAINARFWRPLSGGVYSVCYIREKNEDRRDIILSLCKCKFPTIDFIINRDYLYFSFKAERDD